MVEGLQTGGLRFHVPGGSRFDAYSALRFGLKNEWSMVSDLGFPRAYSPP